MLINTEGIVLRQATPHTDFIYYALHKAIR